MKTHPLVAFVVAAISLAALPLQLLTAQQKTPPPPIAKQPGAARVPGTTPDRAASVVAATRPAAPAALEVRAGLFREAILSWNPVPGVTQYRVFGPPPMPAAGAVVSPPMGSLPTYRATGLAAGTNTFTVSSEYLGVANTPGLPSASLLVLPFSPVSASVSVELASTAVSLSFYHTTAEPLTFRLYRDDGRGGAKSEITAGLQWTRPPGSLPGTTKISAKSLGLDLTPDRSYQYQLTASTASGEIYRSPPIPVSVPQFIVRGTIPLAGDRVVIEWNPFGTAPYRVQKGAVTSAGLTMDFVRDAAGNPMNFTGTRFEDAVVQRGVTYTYMVCARIPLGDACPGVEVRVPAAP
ncbi:MAG: hypothetical protein AABZ29_04590 [Gemmatimonadota bacterium]